jgi:6-pyruvoyltetrahydropterin/6-carboxytetrahydropterin synthase
MVIRKLYRIESAHIVKEAISTRCSRSFHGHSGTIEVFLKSKGLDKARMIYDFGAMKQTIGEFIDMFDHSIHLSEYNSQEEMDFFIKNNSRWIILPDNPTAETYCLLFRDCINEILSKTKFTNGEQGVYCSGVRYHETATGYAESEESDPVKYKLSQLEFSDGTILEVKSYTLKKLLQEAYYKNDN